MSKEIDLREIQDVSKIINEEANNIRFEKGQKYGNSFQEFYSKYGLLGMETDLYRKFSRISQFSKLNDPVGEQKALENNYLDIINYCILQLIFLRHNYWGEFNWEKNEKVDTAGE